MTGVLQGFGVIATIIAAGYLTGRLHVVGEGAQQMLNRLVFFVMTPCLLFTVLIEADATTLLSSLLLVSLLAALACMAAYALIARVIWRRAAPETIIGSLAAGLANAGNIGIPVSLYVLGSAAYVAPIILFQIAILTPVCLALLDIVTTARAGSLGRTILQPLTNPVMIATLLGVTVSALHVQLPAFVIEPFRLIGNASVPLVLIAFGMSLAGQRPLVPGTGRRDVLLAVTLKLLAMPLIAWLLGRYVFGMTGKDLLVVTVLGALPTAQNVFAFAQRYQRGETIARDAGLIATLGSMPVLLAITALLGQ